MLTFRISFLFAEQQEIDVHSILAVDYQSKKNHKNVGMPAFNSKNELVRPPPHACFPAVVQSHLSFNDHGSYLILFLI